jgi:hypothetical protein
MQERNFFHRMPSITLSQMLLWCHFFTGSSAVSAAMFTADTC